MMLTNVRIQRKADPRPAFPEIADKTVIECSLERVAILEGGCDSGRSSLGLMIDMPDGRICWVQVSAGMWDMISGLLRGARQSWGEPSD